MKKLNKKGFTIVELVIVIAVIAILAAVLIPTFATVIEKANKSAAMQACRNEWTNFIADSKDNVVAGYDAVICKDSKYYFAVVDGSFKDIAYDNETDAAKVAYGADSGYTIGSALTDSTTPKYTTTVNTITIKIITKTA